MMMATSPPRDNSKPPELGPEAPARLPSLGESGSAFSCPPSKGCVEASGKSAGAVVVMMFVVVFCDKITRSTCGSLGPNRLPETNMQPSAGGLGDSSYGMGEVGGRCLGGAW